MEDRFEEENLSREISYFTENYRKFYNIAYHITKKPFHAQDVLQEAFFKIINDRNPPQDAEKIESNLKVIVKRTAIDDWRKRRNWTKFTTGDELIDIVRMPKEISAEEKVIEGWEEEHVLQIISKLDIRFQAVVILKVYYELKLGEVAEVLQLNPHTVKSRWNRAKLVLRELWEEEISIDIERGGEKF